MFCLPKFYIVSLKILYGKGIEIHPVIRRKSSKFVLAVPSERVFLSVR